MALARFLKTWLLNADDRRHQTLERLYWAFSFLLSCAVAIGAFLSVYFARRAADAGWEAARQAEQQAKIAQEQLAQSKVASLPYVVLQIDGDRVSSNRSETGLVEKGFSSVYTVKLRFTNFGATPAIIRHIEGLITINLPRTGYVNVEEHTTDLVLSPGKPTDDFNWRKEVSYEQERRLAEDTSSKLYVVGRITYTDVSGKLLVNVFCYFMPTHSRDQRTRILPGDGPGCSNRNGPPSNPFAVD